MAEKKYTGNTALEDKKKIPKRKPPKPPKPDPIPMSNIHRDEMATWLTAVGGGPHKYDKAKKAQKARQLDSLIKGSPIRIRELLNALKSESRRVNFKHPRANGKLFDGMAAMKENVDDTERAGKGGKPMMLGQQGGDSFNWYFPGGKPPEIDNPRTRITVWEAGELWSSERQPWKDPGYPTMQDLVFEAPDPETPDPNNPGSGTGGTGGTPGGGTGGNPVIIGDDPPGEGGGDTGGDDDGGDTGDGGEGEETP